MLGIIYMLFWNMLAIWSSNEVIRKEETEKDNTIRTQSIILLSRDKECMLFFFSFFFTFMKKKTLSRLYYAYLPCTIYLNIIL